MKKNFKTKLILFILIATVLLTPICFATSDIAPISSKSIVENEIDNTYEFIASDVYEFDQDVVIDLIVDGNVFAFGNNITISSEIGGDVFAFGGTVTISDKANIHGNIFVFAKDFIMNGTCYDIYGATSTFTLNSTASVARDIRIGADKVNLNGQIKRDAYISTDELIFPESASNLISGNLNYTSYSEIAIASGIVGGNIKYTPETNHEATIIEKVSAVIINILSTILYSLAIVLFAIWLTPNFKEKVATILKKKAALSFGIGILTCIVIVLSAFALLIMTDGLGLGISIAIVTIFILALTISKTIFSMACAKLINTKLNKNNNSMFIFMTLLIVVLVSISELIPYLGGFIGFAITMIGLGILVFNLINKKTLTDNV